jgi:dihydropteroate synthase
MKTYDIPLRSGTLFLGRRTLVMGIVNVTPDSFSDGGDFFARDHAVAQGIRLVEAGADILDIGGESTRPGSRAVGVDEEVKRVVPVIAALTKKTAVPISVDTTKSVVARKAIDAGAAIINDISALRFDPEMVTMAAACRVPVVLMHMKGTPKDMQEKPVYEDVTGEILEFFKDVMDFAQNRGINRSALIVDPGIGFGKTFSHNLTVLKHLDRFRQLDAPVLVGSSRKAFLRNLLVGNHEGPVDPKLPEVEAATQASVSAAVLNGAHIVRVHNVANTVATLKVIDAIKYASD